MVHSWIARRYRFERELQRLLKKDVKFYHSLEGAPLQPSITDIRWPYGNDREREEEAERLSGYRGNSELKEMISIGAGCLTTMGIATGAGYGGHTLAQQIPSNNLLIDISVSTLLTMGGAIAGLSLGGIGLVYLGEKIPTAVDARYQKIIKAHKDKRERRFV